jgi:predicted O-methyltransferase YrrM
LSTDVARSFNKRIDLLFIDGDHSYEGVKEDVEAWFPKLNEKAVVIFHDIGWAEGVQKVVAECVRPSAGKEIFLPNLYAAFVGEKVVS